MVWLVMTLVNVYELTAPTEWPSTRTSVIQYRALVTVIVKVASNCFITCTAPAGLIVPPDGSAEAVMVHMAFERAVAEMFRG